MLKLSILVLTTLMGLGSCYISHSDSNSQYIHSNDTIKLFLSNTGSNQLYGAPGSMHNLEFVLVNDWTGTLFTFRQSSEDGFVGVLPTTEKFLSQGQQQKIAVNNLRVPPNRPEGSRIKFTLTVERQPNYRKREAPPQGQSGGGSGSVGGSGGYSGGGSPGYNQQQPGQPNYNDPSFRMQLAMSVEFTVTSEDREDKSEPDADIEYMPDLNGDYCPAEPGDSNCGSYFWWVKITAKDEESGLNAVSVEPEGKVIALSDVYYRYDNWAVGTNKEYVVAAGASCCVEKMIIKITDVAGNVAEVRAKNGEKGSPMDPALMWGLIGGGIALVVIILVVVFVFYRKNYSPVSTGD